MQIKKNDKAAKIIIWILSIVVFGVVVSLDRMKMEFNLSFDPHIFATINAIINGTVSVLLIAGMVAIKNKKRKLHERIMLTAMILSALFLVSYICHHLFAGSTPFGGTGIIKLVYLILLATHILLAAIILPFILFTAYRALTTEYPKHKKLAKITWPIWLYVSITGVVVYLLISPYYT